MTRRQIAIYLIVMIFIALAGFVFGRVLFKHVILKIVNTKTNSSLVFFRSLSSTS